MKGFKIILRKLLFLILALWVMTWIAFYFSISAPGDPVELMTRGADQQVNRSLKSTRDSLRHILHLDQPAFYFSLGTQADPSDLKQLPHRLQQEAALHQSRKSGNPKEIMLFHEALLLLQQDLNEFSYDTALEKWAHRHLENDSLAQQKILQFDRVHHAQIMERVQMRIRSCAFEKDDQRIISQLDSVVLNVSTDPLLQSFLPSLRSAQEQLKKAFEQPPKYSAWLPGFQWNGGQNQYHHWFKALLKGDFGVSYADGLPVQTHIWEKFTRSFILIVMAVFLAFLVSVPVGIRCAMKQGGWEDRSVTIISFILYSLPTYVGGTLLLYFFANREWFDWFPESGYCDPQTYNPQSPWYDRFIQQWPYMILPLITYTYASLAFIIRLVRGSIREEFDQDYFRTAIAKGMSRKQAAWKHAWRNAWIPVITLFVNILPAAIGGSVIVETIFTYPGMGLESLHAIQNADHPTLTAILVLAGFMSMVAYFLADLLYTWVDPRIHLNRR